MGVAAPRIANSRYRREGNQCYIEILVQLELSPRQKQFCEKLAGET